MAPGLSIVQSAWSALTVSNCVPQKQPPCATVAGERQASAAAAHDAATRRRLQALVGGWFGCYIALVTFTIELEPEADGRWLAEVPALPGVMCYGADREEAVARVQALALRVIAERLEHREAPSEFVNVTFQAA
jgi:predicted RNase H-like HicB family nuclease